jgi:nicotinamide-nucleotide amidase
LKLGKTAFRNFETGLPAKSGKVRLRISARGTNKELLEMAIEEYVVSLNLIINDIIVGYEEERRSSFW